MGGKAVHTGDADYCIIGWQFPLSFLKVKWSSSSLIWDQGVSKTDSFTCFLAKYFRRLWTKCLQWFKREETDHNEYERKTEKKNLLFLDVPVWLLTYMSRCISEPCIRNSIFENTKQKQRHFGYNLCWTITFCFFM